MLVPYGCAVPASGSSASSSAVAASGRPVKARPSDECTCEGAVKAKQMCAPCKWRRFGPQWQDLLRRSHLKNNELHICPIIRAPANEGFAVGCDLCAIAGMKDQFAKFNVRTADHIQLVSLRRHCESRKHIAVCQKLGTEVLVSFETRANLGISKQVPDDAKFLWALTTAFCSKDYERFMATDEVKKLLSCRKLPQPEASAQSAAAGAEMMCGNCTHEALQTDHNVDRMRA